MAPKANINSELESLHKLISEIKTDLDGNATLSKIDELVQEIRAKDKKIDILESQIAVLQNSVKILTTKCDNNEQNCRRTSVRINNIPLPEYGSHTSEDVMRVRKMLLGVRGPNFRCAPGRLMGEEGTRKQNTIVKFTSHHRALCYRNRKKLSSVKVYLDLAQTKFKLLKNSRAKLQGSNLVDFVFADINCALCARSKNGTSFRIRKQQPFCF